MNDDWMLNMPSSKVIFLPEGISDRFPIKLDLTVESRMKQKSFMYCNAQGQHPKFKEIMEAGWIVQVQGCKMLRVVKRLKLLKKRLKKLQTQHLSSLLNKANQYREQLQPTQNQLRDTPVNVENQKHERGCHIKLKELSYLAEIHLQQQSKVTWMKLGDNKSKVLFFAIKHRRLRKVNIQLKIQMENGKQTQIL